MLSPSTDGHGKTTCAKKAINNDGITAYIVEVIAIVIDRGSASPKLIITPAGGLFLNVVNSWR